MSTAPIASTPPNGADGPAELGVRYLRVSDPKQTHTTVDIDPEGNSIATQRQECTRKERAKGITVAKEFVEPGKSAQSIDKRPAFKQLLTYIAEHHEIRYVVIYMRSRAFRDYLEAGLTERLLTQRGITLISAKEDFGDGVRAYAVKGIVDIINDVQVRMNGEDIKTKMAHKARSGGTIGRAKLGYLNARIDIDGKQVNTITLDPERAPLVRHAFELYASGDYSLRELSQIMADQGLTTRPTRRWAAKPVSVNRLNQMLLDPYYIGIVTYKGELIPGGRHEPIISQALFDQVQAVMDTRRVRGTRSREHFHYLRGLLYCQRCHDAGRTSRLIYTLGRSHTGADYEYFRCRGRQQGYCDLPYLPVWLVEHAVEKTYATLALGRDFATEMHRRLDATLADEQRLVADTHANLTRELTTLDHREERLLDLAEDGTLSNDKVKERLRSLQLERARIREALTDTSAQLQAGAQALGAALELLDNPEQLYGRAPDDARQKLNQTFYAAIYLDETSTARPTLNPPFDDLHAAAEVFRVGRARAPRSRQPSRQTSTKSAQTARTPENRTSTLADVFTVKGCNKRIMVGATGIEPVTARV